MLASVIALSFPPAEAQTPEPEAPNSPLWHGIERTQRYTPKENGFIIENGQRRFNRALYGTHSGFRVEAGDLPQFALYMPGMGGTLKLGLATTDTSKWLIHADHIKARYDPGMMTYHVTDALLGNAGSMTITVLALHHAEGVVVRVKGEQIEPQTHLIWTFGGATGKRFHRDGDIGADPESSFYLKTEYCADNAYTLGPGNFILFYGSGRQWTEDELYEIPHGPFKSPADTIQVAHKILRGIVPPRSELRLGDAKDQSNPSHLYNSTRGDNPVVVGRFSELNTPGYFCIYNPEEGLEISNREIPSLFNHAKQAVVQLANRVRLQTPDPYINPLGGALAVAADAIWEPPSYLHGAVAWRMRLNGWRGAYAADALGWHERAREHFNAYALSQLTEPATGSVVPDTTRNFARQKEELGTALFSSGYICRNPGGDFRAHHYDMNLVFIDQLLRHFMWTGDSSHVRQMWPVIKRHLAWEKRCFDVDGDHLYDAYCAIWASDALEYSGAGVTHTSAYNYFANAKAAQLALLAGDNPEPYEQEAVAIHEAIDSKLWLPANGWYAEHRDILGLQKPHPHAGLWTVYHALDSEVADPFQAYQALRYVDSQIPHIPITADGFPEGYHTLATTSWMPYTWSVNNVALAEVLHTALGYWEAGRKDEAYRLWKGVICESMYNGASPGGFQQLSFYDAFRGELYRDFADPIGIAARSLVEGLIGIRPDLLSGVILVQPGFPDAWDHASFETPDFTFDFKRDDNVDRYTIDLAISRPVHLQFRTRAQRDRIKSIKVNNIEVLGYPVESAVDHPAIEFRTPTTGKHLDIEIAWTGEVPMGVQLEGSEVAGSTMHVKSENAELYEVYDPQAILTNVIPDPHHVEANLAEKMGHHTFFIRMEQGQMQWWQPIDLLIKPAHSILAADVLDSSQTFRIANHNDVPANILLTSPGNTWQQRIDIPPGGHSPPLDLQSEAFLPGTNRIVLEQVDGSRSVVSITDWSLPVPAEAQLIPIDLHTHFNDQVTQIFDHAYQSPRVPYPTVQIPLQGIGNWCYPLVTATIDDTGLRQLSGADGIFMTPQGVLFRTPGPGTTPNIALTSLWDNFPDALDIPLSGHARHAYLLMAGTTNHMQSRFDNGVVTINYRDGSRDNLMLRNPETWWPIEQDYFFDGYAFASEMPVPPRVHLKTGLVVTREFDSYTSIKGYSDRVIDGGAATILDLPLDQTKELASLELRTLANEVLIGIMALTLVR